MASGNAKAERLRRSRFTSYFAMIKFSAPPPAPVVIPARERTAVTPAVADVTAAFVPVFFFVEELFWVFRVDVVLLTAVPDAAPL